MTIATQNLPKGLSPAAQLKVIKKRLNALEAIAKRHKAAHKSGIKKFQAKMKQGKS